MQRLLPLLLLFILPGCFMHSNCKKEMKRIENRYGSPEETQSYKSDGYKSESWWYWSRGVEYTFAWGSSVDGGCDVTEFTFNPIGKNASQQAKDGAAATRKLVGRESSGGAGCLVCN